MTLSPDPVSLAFLTNPTLAGTWASLTNTIAHRRHIRLLRDARILLPKRQTRIAVSLGRRFSPRLVMMNVDPASLPPRISGRGIANNDATTTTIALSAASRSSFLAGKMLRGADVVQSRSRGSDADATAFRHSRPVNALPGRNDIASHGHDGTQGAVGHVPAGKDRESPRTEQSRKQQLQIPASNSNSQDTTSTTNDTADDIFTPPASAGGLSQANSQSNGQDSSSQESQLLQLSQIAATREKMLNSGAGSDGSSGGQDIPGQSRKRMADGVFKSPSDGSSASPVLRGGHSRNTSTVSVASTTGSRLGEVCSKCASRDVK